MPEEEMRMTKGKRMVTGIIVALFLLLSTGMTVWAARTTTSFNYAGKTVQCVLHVDWSNNSTAYSRTYVTGGSGFYPLRSYIFGYDRAGKIIKSNSFLSYDDVNSGTIDCNAVKFMSQHEILNSNRVVLDYRRLTLEE